MMQALYFSTLAMLVLLVAACGKNAGTGGAAGDASPGLRPHRGNGSSATPGRSGT